MNILTTWSTSTQLQQSTYDFLSGKVGYIIDSFTPVTHFKVIWVCYQYLIVLNLAFDFTVTSSSLSWAPICILSFLLDLYLSWCARLIWLLIVEGHFQSGVKPIGIVYIDVDGAMVGYVCMTWWWHSLRERAQLRFMFIMYAKSSWEAHCYLDLLGTWEPIALNLRRVNL